MQYAPLSDDSPPASEIEKGSSEHDNSIHIPGSKVIQSLKNNKTTNKHLSEPLTSSSSADNDLILYENGDDIEKNQSNGGPSSMIDDDPFYVFKQDLERKLELVEEGLSRYLRVVHDTDTAVNSHDVKEKKKQLKRHIKNAESTLKDLQTTVLLVETKRDKFLRLIPDHELQNRKEFVQSTSQKITSSKRAMNSDSVKAKMMQDERNMATRRAGNFDDARTQIEKENSAFIVEHSSQARLMLRQQDETLEELDEAVTRVGSIADNIHEEIGSQNKMLQALEDDLHDAEEKLGLVMGKLGKLLKTKNKWQICTILVLMLVVLILFFLVLYT